jgi:hypothetical protein
MTRIAGRHPLTGEPVIVRVRETPTPPPKATPTDAAALTVPKLVSADVDGEGFVVARLCTFGVPDLQEDVVSPTAFGRVPQEVVCSAWNHSAYQAGHGALPVGVGLVRAEGNFGVFRGRLLLETAAGRDTFEVLKAMGGRCQWSWGFALIRHHRGTVDNRPVRYLDEVVVNEVSPVLNAASIGSGTVELRDSDPARLAEQRQGRERQRAPADAKAREKRALNVELERARALGIRV